MKRRTLAAVHFRLDKPGCIHCGKAMPAEAPRVSSGQSNPWPRALVLLAVIFAATGVVEYLMGRSPLGPDGRFGWWQGGIWSNENSQRFADPYSFSHLTHGILFFWFLRWVAPRLPVPQRLLIAALLEASWELLENSPIIINRYRAATISLGYDGDSILNSMSDILMMCVGYMFASRMRLGVCLAAVLLMEIGCAVFVRDNLTLNVIMLIHPIDAIKQWQMAGAPPGVFK
jgi:hypothetical protein